MRRAMFVNSQVSSAWVLVEAWTIGRSKTTERSSARRRRRLNDQLLEVGLA